MSSQQSDLAEFKDTTPAWTPGTEPSDGSECQQCGSHVSDQFARVFGDNNNDVHACLSCSFAGELNNGAGWNPEFDRRVDGDHNGEKK